MESEGSERRNAGSDEQKLNKRLRRRGNLALDKEALKSPGDCASKFSRAQQKRSHLTPGDLQVCSKKNVSYRVGNNKKQTGRSQQRP
jgi:hypothetical protein